MKKTTAILLITVLLGSACIFSSCSKTERTVAGGVVGAAAGAGIGSAAGGTEGAVAGGVIGAVTGGLIGRSTHKDKK